MYEEKERFTITDDSGAEWALKKIHEAQEDRDKWAAFYDAQKRKIIEEAANTIQYMTMLLEEYFRSVPHRTTKTGIEKYKLPSGELQMRPARIEYEHDDTQLLKWAEENHPEFIKVTRSPIWIEIKKLIVASGNLPDGVTPVEKPAEFKIGGAE